MSEIRIETVRMRSKSLAPVMKKYPSKWRLCSILCVSACVCMLVLSGCGRRNKSVSRAQEIVESSNAPSATSETVARQGPPTFFDSEKYLPVQERLRRRQERLYESIRKQGGAAATPQAAPPPA